MSDMRYDTPRSRGDRDAPHMSPVTPSEDLRTIMINRVSWGAVLAGVVVALVAQLLLNLLGVGVGASTIDPGTGDNPSASSFSLVAAAWWAVSGIIAAFIGGYVASRLSGRPKPSTGAWHGLISWAFTTLVVFFLLGSAIGGVIGGAFNALGSAVGGLGRTAASVAETAAPALADSPDPFSAIEEELRTAAGANDPEALRDAAVTAMRAVVTGDEAQAEAARERAAQALSRAQNIPVEEARGRVEQYEQQYRQTVDQMKQQAVEAADVTAKTVSRGALLGTLALLLGAVAAWFGGRAGSVEPTITAAPPMGRGA